MLVADGNSLEREGLTVAVRSALPAIQVDVAGSVAEAESLAARHRYGLAILDMDLPGSRGFSGFLRLQHGLEHVPIILLSADRTAELIEAARALGAAGYLSKGMPLDGVRECLRCVYGGGTAFPPVQEVGDSIQRARRAVQSLSGAQLRVLTALAEGRSNKQIAGDLGVTEATVKAHLSATFRKLGVQNRAQALLAMQPLLANPPQAR
ncbi:MAG: response regulator transcription factor [Sphingomonas sp.]